MHINIAEILITLGCLFLLGLLADLAGRNTPLPRVTLLLLTGFTIGPSGLDWLPEFTNNWFPVLTDIALAMIGFILGQNMTRSRFQELGRSVISISISVVVITVLVVFTVLILFGVPYDIALLLAGISPATAPAATVDTIREYRANGRFTNTLLGVVALDDAWGLLVFSMLIALIKVINGDGGGTDILIAGGWEIGGAVLLGVLLGLPMAYLTGRIHAGEPTQAEVLGFVLLCAGFAVWIEVSYILSTMILGATVANLATHHNIPFRAIKGVEWPFLILFFMLAGAALHVEALAQVGFLGAAYIGLRITGRILGSWLGGWLSNTEPATYHWIGFAMLPQAGVAIGMALLAAQRFPDLSDIILPIILGSTVIFELFGPIATRWTLGRVGDIPKKH